MRIGACLWSLPEDPHEAAAWAREAGFEAIDVDPGFAAGWDAEGGLPVASVAIAHLMPDGAALEAADDQARTRALDHVRAGLSEAAELGAEFVYLPPASADDSASRARYRQAVVDLSDEAQRLGIKFGIEHFPGYALPSVALTQQFVEEVAHPNLFVLLDIGHAQISGESVSDAVAALGGSDGIRPLRRQPRRARRSHGVAGRPPTGARPGGRRQGAATPWIRRSDLYRDEPEAAGPPRGRRSAASKSSSA